jgi:hypothetical protein
MATKQEQLRELYYETIRNDGEHEGCRICHKMMEDTELGADNLQTFVSLPPRVENVNNIDYIFVAMEPTTNWLHDNDIISQVINDGMYGFAYSTPELRANSGKYPFIFKFAIYKYLCDGANNYLLTDWAKCCMPANQDINSIERDNRCNNCLQWLNQEIKIIEPKAIFPIGVTVEPIAEHFPNVQNFLHHYAGGRNPNHFFNTFCEDNENRENYQKLLIDIGLIQRDLDNYVDYEITLIQDDDCIQGQTAERIIDYYNTFLRGTTLNAGARAYFKRLFYYKTKFEDFKKNQQK